MTGAVYCDLYLNSINSVSDCKYCHSVLGGGEPISWYLDINLFFFVFQIFITIYIFLIKTRLDLASHNVGHNDARRKTEKEAPIVKSPKLATVARRNKDNRVSLYNVASIHPHHSDHEADQLLQYNIYDATPDHSILKHGMAKSLSNFHLGSHLKFRKSIMMGQKYF